MILTKEQVFQLFADQGIFDEEGNQLFELVEEKQSYLDLEKGYRKMDFVIKDMSNEKFYQGKGIVETPDEAPKNNVQWFEVYPYTETITKYK